MSEPVLELRGLRRWFTSGDRELHVLNGVDFELHAGEIVGLVGPSGSGKSSLLHAAGLLERPSDGQVLIAGVSAWELGDRERTKLRRAEIGFVYQFHHLLAEFDALDNVALPAMIAGAHRSSARAEARRLLITLGLKDRVHHQPSQLSGGEQQRVTVARALANQPSLILADEPTAALDSVRGRQVMELFRDVAHEHGTGVIVVTHDHRALDVFDTVYEMEDGVLRLATRAGIDAAVGQALAR